MNKVFYLVLLAILFNHSVAFSLDAGFTVAERYGTARVNEPVSSGIPLSKLENITSVSKLAVYDSSNVLVPAQFRILSRYNGAVRDSSKPARMVLVDFLTDISSLERKSFRLKNDAAPPQNANVTQNANLASETSEGITISTGKIVVKINRNNFNLFDKVFIDKDNDGLINDPLVSTSSTDGIIITYKGKEYTSYYSKPYLVAIEENGPLKTVVRVRGHYMDSLGNKLMPPSGDVGLGYSVRFKAYKNSDFIKVEYRLENENMGWSYQSAYPVHNINIDSLNLRTTLSLNLSKTVKLENYQDTFTESTYSLKQDHKEVLANEASNFIYTVQKGVTETVTGARAEGVVDLRDSEKGVMTATRWFWQNWPKEIKIENNVLNNYLWADMTYDHKLLGGIYKTHEMIYCFHAAVNNDENFKSKLAAIKKRLLARTSDTYYASAEFMGFMPPEQITSSYTFPANETLQVALDKYNYSIRAKYDSGCSTVKLAKATITSLRENRPMKWNGGTLKGKRINWYGWLNFGDLARGGSYGFPALHYSWDYISLLHSLRFDDYDMLEIAEEMINHKIDIDIIHDPTGADEAGAWDEDYYRGGHRWEADAHMQLGGDHAAAGAGNSPRGASHLWIKSFVLQYLLTGDARYYETIKEVADHLVYAFSSSAKTSCDTKACWGNETRHQSRAINSLVEIWRLTGDPLYLDVAYNIFKNGLLSKEVNNGGWFMFGSGKYAYCSNGPCDVWSFYQSITVEPLTNLFYAFKNSNRSVKAASVFDFLLREANWMKNSVFTNYSESDSGVYKGNNYFPYCTKIGWRRNSKWPVGTGYNDGAYSFAYADNFALLYRETGEKTWLNLARSVFKDAMMYSGCGSFKSVNLSTTVTASGFYNNPTSSYQKAGKMMSKPLLYLHTEWKEAAVILPDPNNPPVAVLGFPGKPQNNEAFRIAVGSSLNFSAEGSHDPDGDSLSYMWNFGTASQVKDSTAKNPANITFNVAGVFNIRLTVTDSKWTPSAPATSVIVVTIPIPAAPSIIGVP